MAPSPRFTSLDGRAQQVSRELAEAAAFDLSTSFQSGLEGGLEEKLGARKTVPSTRHHRPFVP